MSSSSGETSIEDSLANDFEGLTVTAGEEYTPEQRRNRTGTQDATQSRRKLDFNSTESSTSAQTDEQENTDGKWLQNHPWQEEHPNLQMEMSATISESKDYTVSDNWKRDKKVDLQNIYSDLPKFVHQMRGLTSREELEKIVKQNMKGKHELTPHVKEITNEQKGIKPKDKPFLREDGQMFKAFSLTTPKTSFVPSPENYWYLDCEYTLKMYLPDDSLQWFTEPKDVRKRIRTINHTKKEMRWIFTPSFLRSEIALLDWPEDETVTKDSTIRILVVRPSEFEKYVKHCGHKFPVISLPNDEIGAGYPRLWIQKIALRLKLEFIWMIDDSLECFYEYHPSKQAKDGYKVQRRRPFGKVFERIEKYVKETKTDESPIAAMSPKRFMGGRKVNNAFLCSPPQIAVFLNLRALKEKDVYYRPELQAFEDMIFGYECEKNGLKVFRDNRVHLQDHRWMDTGARAPSVQQKQGTQS